MERAGNWNGKGELADALTAASSVPGPSQKVCCSSLPDVWCLTDLGDSGGKRSVEKGKSVAAASWNNHMSQNDQTS